MSVLIKHMAMPKGCIYANDKDQTEYCPLLNHDEVPFCQYIENEPEIAIGIDERPVYCPLSDVPEPCQDTVSRQAAIDALTHKWDGMVTSVFDVVNSLPSAQPDLDSAYTEGYTAAESKYRKMWDEMQANIKEKAFGKRKGLVHTADIDAIAQVSENLNMQIGNDPVNHPSHYTQGKVECIDAMEMVFGETAVAHYCLCAAFKYMWRRKDKGNEEQDKAKAEWYWNKFMEIINR